MYKKLNINKLKKVGTIIFVGASILTTKNVLADNLTDNISSYHEIDSNIDENNYVKDDDSYYAIKTNGKSLEELFEIKAKFLLGEEHYEKGYKNEDNMITFSKKIDEMYGEGATSKLKEFEYRCKNLDDMTLSIEYGNLGLSCNYEKRQISIFPDSEYREYKENLISYQEIKMKAITNVINNKKSDYQTLYEMNEFFSACLGNASNYGNINSFNKVWGQYKTKIIDPVVALVETNGKIVEYSAMNAGKYSIYNKIENNPYTYNLIEEKNKLYIK